MIRITIEGERGEGKTTTALLIGELLHLQEFNVEYVGSTRQWTREVNKKWPNGSFPKGTIQIIDKQ